MNLHAPPTPDELAAAARRYEPVRGRAHTLQTRRRAATAVGAALVVALAVGLPVGFLSGADHHTTVKFVSPLTATTAPGTTSQRTPTTTTGVTTSSSTTVPADAAVYRVAIAELQAYLDLWQRTNESVASKQFMVARQQCVTDCPLVLRSGKVLSYQPSSWQSPDHFTLLVGLDLRFVGSSLAFDQGPQAEFVTFSRPNAQAKYLLEFNTSPGA